MGPQRHLHTSQSFSCLSFRNYLLEKAYFQAYYHKLLSYSWSDYNFSISVSYFICLKFWVAPTHFTVKPILDAPDVSRGQPFLWRNLIQLFKIRPFCYLGHRPLLKNISQKSLSTKNTSLYQRVATSNINGMVPSGCSCSPNSHCFFIFIIMKVFDEVWGPTICLNLALTEICPFGQILKGAHGRKIRPSFMILVSYDFLKFREWILQSRLSMWNLGSAKINKNKLFVVFGESQNQLND